jgi:hypothetical protein
LCDLAPPAGFDLGLGEEGDDRTLEALRSIASTRAMVCVLGWRSAA